MALSLIMTYTLRAVAFALPLTCMISVVRMAYQKHRRITVDRRKEFLQVGLTFYLLSLIEITVIRGGEHLLDWWRLSHGWQTLQLLPIITTLQEAKNGVWAIAYPVLGNLLWFVPLGFLLGLWKPSVSLRKTIAISMLVSVGIELFQWILVSGISDIDDVIFNVCGGLAGYVISRFIKLEKKEVLPMKTFDSNYKAQMNENLYRTKFYQMKRTEKQVLMEELAAGYDMTFIGLHTFDRWGQSCTTGTFEKNGQVFVFVPGDTVILGWEQFAVGLNQESKDELDYLLKEWELERDPEELIRENMTAVHQATIEPMLVGQELEEIGWEQVKLGDPRLQPNWLEKFRQFALTDRDSLTLNDCARFERDGDNWQAFLYHEVSYIDFRKLLQKQGFSLPTADEWAYLCGGGCRTLFPWGDGLDYSMHLHWFESSEDEDKPYDMEELNFFGLSIAYDPYMREIVKGDALTTCGGDGGCNICGGMGPFLGFLPCSPHYKPRVQEDNDLNGDYDFYRPIIRVKLER